MKQNPQNIISNWWQCQTTKTSMLKSIQLKVSNSNAQALETN